MSIQTQEHEQTDQRREMRERAIYPILIPLAAIVVIEIIVFSMSRVLLATGHMTATWIALAAALGILIGAALAAARPRMTRGGVTAVMVLVALITFGSAGWALMQDPYYEREALAARPEIVVTAADLAFDTDRIELSTAGTIIDFDNRDTQPHNVAVYPAADQLNDPLFRGEIINGGARRTYQVPELEAGTYHFICDVHPTMEGEAVVEEGETGAAGH